MTRGKLLGVRNPCSSFLIPIACTFEANLSQTFLVLAVVFLPELVYLEKRLLLQCTPFVGGNGLFISLENKFRSTVCFLE